MQLGQALFDSDVSFLEYVIVAGSFQLSCFWPFGKIPCMARGKMGIFRSRTYQNPERVVTLLQLHQTTKAPRELGLMRQNERHSRTSREARK
jgi:hypothetical protein